MDSSIETPEKCIELFVLLNQEYISAFILSEILSKCENRRQIFYMGWKTMTHFFKMTRNMQLPIKDTYIKIKRSIIIYIEYIEQVLKTDSEYDTNISWMDFGKIFTFIHKKIFEDQSSILSTSLMQISEVEVSRMIKITETILLWNNENFNTENHLSVCNQFLQSYVLLLNNERLVHYIDVLDFLFEKIFTGKQNDFEDYVSFLTEYYLFISRGKRHLAITESMINDIYLNKYYTQIELFDNMVSLRKKERDSKSFIKWFFTT